MPDSKLYKVLAIVAVVAIVAIAVVVVGPKLLQGVEETKPRVTAAVEKATTSTSIAISREMLRAEALAEAKKTTEKVQPGRKVLSSREASFEEASSFYQECLTPTNAAIIIQEMSETADQYPSFAVYQKTLFNEVEATTMLYTFKVGNKWDYLIPKF